MLRSRGEMDIMVAFEAIVGGSNPSGSTNKNKRGLTLQTYVPDGARRLPFKSDLWRGGPSTGELANSWLGLPINNRWASRTFSAENDP